jgi:predicted 2-oxoglutarate/Fe(II)-dependent dioxygenase YbiX
MLAAPGDRSLVTLQNADDITDEQERQSVKAKVDASTKALVETRFAGLMPELERHYLVALRGWQQPQFLIYSEGGHIQPHRDQFAGKDPVDGAERDRRQVSTVIFLNGQGEDGENTFSGGYLTFYGLVGGAVNLPVPLIAEPGLLVAFRSTMIHYVTPVTRGKRFAVACWFVS